MPKFAKPFYRSARNCWFVQIGKEQIKLHSDETEAFRLYHELMAERGKPQPAAPIRPGSPPLAEVLDKFLDWCKRIGLPARMTSTTT